MMTDTRGTSRPMTVRTVMARDPVTIGPEASLRAASELLLKALRPGMSPDCGDGGNADRPLEAKEYLP